MQSPVVKLLRAASSYHIQRVWGTRYLRFYSLNLSFVFVSYGECVSENKYPIFFRTVTVNSCNIPWQALKKLSQPTTSFSGLESLIPSFFASFSISYQLRDCLLGTE